MGPSDCHEQTYDSSPFSASLNPGVSTTERRTLTPFSSISNCFLSISVVCSALSTIKIIIKFTTSPNQAKILLSIKFYEWLVTQIFVFEILIWFWDCSGPVPSMWVGNFLSLYRSVRNRLLISVDFPRPVSPNKHN